MEEENMKKISSTYERTRPSLVDISTLFVRIATFVALTVGGILGYYFIDRHFVEESKSNKILAVLNSNLATLELAIKEQRNRLALEESRTKIEESKTNKMLAVLNTNLATLDLAIRERKNRLALEESQAHLVESKANALLIDINRKIAEIDREVKEFSKHLEIIQKETQVSILTTEFLNNLTPSFEVIYFPEKASFKEGILSLVYSLGNKGKYSFVIERPEVVLATEEIEEGKPVRGELQLGQDYYFTGSLSRPGYLSPSRTMPYEARMILQRNIPKTLYYTIKFTARTADPIAKVASRYTKGLLTEDELATQCKFTVSFSMPLAF